MNPARFCEDHPCDDRRNVSSVRFANGTVAAATHQHLVHLFVRAAVEGYQ